LQKCSVIDSDKIKLKFPVWLVNHHALEAYEEGMDGWLYSFLTPILDGGGQFNSLAALATGKEPPTPVG
jgi:hypothetical protein